MTKDNQQNKVEFCRELGVIVYEVIGSYNKSLSIIEELYDLYKPKSQEEANKFYSLKYDLPDSAGLLCAIRELIMPNDDEFNDSISPLIDAALDVATRMVGAKVIFNDIISMYVEPHDDDTFIHLYLTLLKPISNSISYMGEKMNKIHKETSQLWPELMPSYDKIDLDEDECEEEAVLPGELKGFSIMKRALIEAFTIYTNEHKSERILGFFMAIQNYLADFEKGVEPDDEFDFGFNLVTSHYESEYIDFSFETGMIQVSSGGYVNDKAFGGDSYTNWMYSIWLNGCEDNNYYNCDFSKVLDLVCDGAKLSIDIPDEYMECDDEE